MDKKENQPIDHAGVKLPPPFLFAGAIGAGILLHRLWPIAWPLPGLHGLRVAGFTAAALGLALIVACWFRFRGAGTPIEPWKPSSQILQSGPYAFSRNPIYLGMAVIHAGVALGLSSTWVLLTLFPAFFVIRYYVIDREERYLDRAFGEDYRRYQRAVRRWL